MGLYAGRVLLESLDVLLVPQRQPDVVQALQQPPAGVVVDLERRHDVAAVTVLDRRSTVTSVPGAFSSTFQMQLDVVLGDLGGQQSLLAGVAAEDVGEPGGQTALKP